MEDSQPLRYRWDIQFQWNVHIMKDDPRFNTEFVQIIQQYPVIYDYTLSGYSKRLVVDKAWDEIVDIVKTRLNENCTAEDCKVRWKGLRSSFNRYRNKRLTAEKEGRPYYLYDALQFISPFTKTRASTMIDLNAFNQTDDLHLEESDSEQLICNSADFEDQVRVKIEDDYILELGPEMVSQRTPECSSTTQTKYQSQSNVLEPEAIITEDSEDGSPRRPVKRKHDDPRNDPYINDLNFFKSILPDIKDFTPQQNRKFKIRVLELIDEIESISH